VHNNVADPGCISRIRIFFHPGSRIIQNKEEEKNKLEISIYKELKYCQVLALKIVNKVRPQKYGI
jgi:hypothetical protein